jgi:hypothetical protein
MGPEVARIAYAVLNCKFLCGFRPTLPVFEPLAAPHRGQHHSARVVVERQRFRRGQPLEYHGMDPARVLVA